MKKTYKAPTIKVNIVAVHQMLCTSDPKSLMGTYNNDAVNSEESDNNLGKEDFDW